MKVSQPSRFNMTKYKKNIYVLYILFFVILGYCSAQGSYCNCTFGLSDTNPLVGTETYLILQIQCGTDINYFDSSIEIPVDLIKRRDSIESVGSLLGADITYQTNYLFIHKEKTNGNSARMEIPLNCSNPEMHIISIKGLALYDYKGNPIDSGNCNGASRTVRWVCPRGQEECGGICLTCTGGKVCINEECRCSGDRKECNELCCPRGMVCINGECSCPDGQIECGGTCLTCTGGKECINGKCACPYGTIDCDGTCLTCTGGKECINGKCACPYGTIDCDGTCLTCTGGKECINGKCACPYGTIDCGGTCLTCTGGKECINGECTCPGNRKECDELCCPSGGICINNTCACPVGQKECNGSCVPINTAAHCGDCYRHCNQNESCCGDRCVDLSSDAYNCNKCGYVCLLEGLKTKCNNGRCEYDCHLILFILIFIFITADAFFVFYISRIINKLEEECPTDLCVRIIKSLGKMFYVILYIILLLIAWLAISDYMVQCLWIDYSSKYLPLLDFFS